MKVKDLAKLVRIIVEQSEKLGYAAKITQLKNLLAQYISKKNTIANQTTSQPIQQTQLTTQKSNIEKLRTEVLQLLQEIREKLLDYDIIKTLKKLKIDNPFGDFAIQLLNRVKTEMDTNAEALSTELTQYSQKLNSFHQFATTINTVLGEDYMEPDEETNELIVYFEGGANVESLKELSTASSNWNVIVNCMGRLTRENDTEIKIISIEKGSLIATLAIATTIIIGITKTSDKILDLILKLYEVRKKALELKLMKMDVIAKAVEMIEEQTKLNIEEKAKTIAENLLEEYNWNTDEELYHEVKEATIKAVKKMIKFQNLGGKIDTNILSPSAEEINITNRIKVKNIEFQKVEEEVLKLSGKKEILQLEGDTNSDDIDELIDDSLSKEKDEN